ncbi:hypothetical protein BY457_11588 [Marinilabilia salmonicolor]|jgi:hypothetical protein|nr:hypothetical protein BY457_11588 [Marinilabilia salmonicolor]
MTLKVNKLTREKLKDQQLNKEMPRSRMIEIRQTPGASPNLCVIVLLMRIKG